jgi:glycosyltransferase involved in cell wall biosynthesis
MMLNPTLHCDKAPSLGLTIAICAYNAASRLPAALSALARQSAPFGITWETIVIDNASTDSTAATAQNYASQLPVPMRLIREDRPGLIHARRRAAIEAKGRILSYIDDDNIVESDWAARCVEFFDTHPRAGVIGGRVAPDFEDPASRPDDFQQRYADALAIRDLGEQKIMLIPPSADPPPGAGMTGRTEVFRKALIEIGCQLTGRRGKSLTSGEDTEIGLIAHRLGWELWYAPTLRMRHVLPPSRLTPAYLDKLISRGARSEAWLDYLRGKQPRRSRLAYLVAAAKCEAESLRIHAVTLLSRRNHPSAHRFGFWKELYHSRALGYFQLARSAAVDRFERRLSDHSIANCRSDYSYLSASIGSSREAFHAG